MKKILIINAIYYSEINRNLLKTSKKILHNKKMNLSEIVVPGVFEIPVVVSKNIKKYDGFLALGCIIKGETPHFNLIARSTFDGIMNISILYKKPIGNGIITALNMKQAKSRCSTKGIEAAKAIIAVLKNAKK